MVKPFITFEPTKIMTSKGDDPLDCSDCKKSIEQCVCVCPYCGERDKCECVISDLGTGG